jgi:hypothetical protein
MVRVKTIPFHHARIRVRITALIMPIAKFNEVQCLDYLLHLAKVRVGLPPLSW